MDILTSSHYSWMSLITSRMVNVFHRVFRWLYQIHQKNHNLWQLSVQFCHSVLSDTLRALGLQHAKLPGESHGRRSLTSYSPYGRKELDVTERLSMHAQPRFHSAISSPLSDFIEMKRVRALLWITFGLRECVSWFDPSRPLKLFPYQQ